MILPMLLLVIVDQDLLKHLLSIWVVSLVLLLVTIDQLWVIIDQDLLPLWDFHFSGITCSWLIVHSHI